MAFDSRVLIEQAKDALSQTHRLDMDSAYRLLRHQSWSTQTPAAVVSAGVIDDSIRIIFTQPPTK